MSEKNKLTVKIHGFEYKLISDDPKNYMKSVANYVDTRMNDIAAANKKLSTSMSARPLKSYWRINLGNQLKNKKKFKISKLKLISAVTTTKQSAKSLNAF